MDLTEAEDTKKRWQEYTEELYKKDLHDPDNHDGVITYLEPDILECEVKWALESITTNKASGGDGIPVLSSFKSSKMMLFKCCTQYASTLGKLSSGHRTGKGQFSFQSQTKTMSKNAETTTLLHSSSKVMLKILQARLQQYMNHELPAGFRKGRGNRDQNANTHWIIEKQRKTRKTTSASLTTPLTVWITINCGNSERDGNTRSPDLPLEKPVCRSRSNWTWFQIGKGVCQGCILSPCLFNLYAEYIMRNTRLDEAQARIKMAGRNINILRYADNTTLMAESEEELKSLLMKMRGE